MIACGVEPASATSPTRVGGDERFERSALVSRALFPDGADAVVVVSGEVPADSLAAGALAAALDAPLLFAASNFLPRPVEDELERLGRPEVTIVGGVESISADVEEWLRSFDNDHAPRRIAGRDRFATAAQIARQVAPDGAESVLVASGMALPDAMTASAAASRLGTTVLLTTRDDVPDETITELRRLAPRRVVISGGAAAVSPAVEAELQTLAPEVTRAAGIDRYATAAELSRMVGPATGAVLAQGETPWNALLAGHVAHRNDAALLLVRAGCMPAATQERLQTIGGVVQIVGNVIDLSDDAVAGHPCSRGERLQPLSDEARAHLRVHGSRSHRWQQPIITFWADPFFDGGEVHRALEAWNAELSPYGTRIARASDKESASIVFEVGPRPGPESGVPQTACGSEGPSRYEDNRIVAGHGVYYVHEDGCSRSTDWTVGIAHGIGHILGLFEHSTTDDLMGTGRSGGPLLPSLGSHQVQTLRWLYTNPVGAPIPA